MAALPDDFRARLRALRRGAGLRQSELAARIGASAGLISHYETGRSRPGPLLFGRLCAALGVAPEALGLPAPRGLRELRWRPGGPAPAAGEVLAARRRLGLGQREAALRCGISRGLLADIEVGRRASPWVRAHILRTLTAA